MQITSRHDPLTQQRIHFLCQRLLNQPHYKILKAPLTFVRQCEIKEQYLDLLASEMQCFRTELFLHGFLPEGCRFFMQPNGSVALTGFEFFHFKMLRPDGSWYSSGP